MAHFKKYIYKIIMSYPRFFGFIIKVLVLKLKILDPTSHEFAWFLKKTDLKIPIKVTLSNGMPILGYLGERVTESIRSQGYYEKETVGLVEKILKPGMIFFDVGTHIGQYTLLASRLVSENGCVHSFEADINNYNVLIDNLNLNNLNNIQASNVAIADKAGTLNLYLGDPSNLGTNSIVEPHNFSGKTAFIKSISLDYYVLNNNIKGIDLIKVDIEGAEYLMLQGCKELLDKDHKPIIIMELNNSQLSKQNASIEKVINFLERYQYKIFRIENFMPYVPNADDPNFLNVVAMPRHKVQWFEQFTGSVNGNQIFNT